MVDLLSRASSVRTFPDWQALVAALGDGTSLDPFATDQKVSGDQSDFSRYTCRAVPVSDFFPLISELNIKENLTLARMAAASQSPENAWQVMSALAHRAGLDQHLLNFPTALRRDERIAAMFVRALAVPAPLIIVTPERATMRIPEIVGTLATQFADVWRELVIWRIQSPGQS